jgi:HK97 family phage major capsid protein
MSKRLKNMQARKANLLKEYDAIVPASEEGGFTDEQLARRTELIAGMTKVSAEITDEEAFLAHQSTLKPIYESEAPALISQKPAFLDDPKKGFKSTQEFFRSVLEASMHGTNDERLLHLGGNRNGFRMAVGSDEHGTYADPYGGFLVPSGFLPQLLQVAAEADPTTGRTTQIPMTSPTVTIPARTDKTHTSSVSGGLVVYRRSETQAVTASRMAVEQVTLTATPLMGLSYATEELISDSAISFVALLEAGFRDEFASKLLNEKINGTGAGTMEGVLNSDCAVGITKETAQTADTIVWQNIIKMRARCWRYQDAIWLYNHDALPQLMQLVMTVGTSGVPLWQTSAREDTPDMILGRPAYPTEYCPTVGDAGDILLGNWSQYLEGTLQGLQSAESMHVRFEYNERTFRFTMRNDGRCWWRSALTPKKSSNTLSPFVYINARA